MKPKRFQKRSLANNPSKALLVAAQMPPLRHLSNEPFDIGKSEAVLWLVAQPAVLQATFEYYKDRGDIVFDQATGTWKGAQ